MCIKCWQISGECKTLPTCDAIQKTSTDNFYHDLWKESQNIIQVLQEEIEELKADIALREKEIIDIKVWHANLGIINQKLEQENQELKKQLIQMPQSIKLPTRQCPLSHTVEEFYKCKICFPPPQSQNRDKNSHVEHK